MNSWQKIRTIPPTTDWSRVESLLILKGFILHILKLSLQASYHEHTTDEIYERYYYMTNSKSRQMGTFPASHHFLTIVKLSFIDDPNISYTFNFLVKLHQVLKSKWILVNHSSHHIHYTDKNGWTDKLQRISIPNPNSSCTLNKIEQTYINNSWNFFNDKFSSKAPFLWIADQP